MSPATEMSMPVKPRRFQFRKSSLLTRSCRSRSVMSTPPFQPAFIGALPAAAVNSALPLALSVTARTVAFRLEAKYGAKLATFRLDRSTAVLSVSGCGVKTPLRSSLPSPWTPAAATVKLLGPGPRARRSAVMRRDCMAMSSTGLSDSSRALNCVRSACTAVADASIAPPFSRTCSCAVAPSRPSSRVMGAAERTAGAKGASAMLPRRTFMSSDSGLMTNGPLARSQPPSVLLSMVSHRLIGWSGGCGSATPSTVAARPVIT